MIRLIFFLIVVAGILCAAVQHIEPTLWEVIALALAAAAFSPRIRFL